MPPLNRHQRFKDLQRITRVRPGTKSHAGRENGALGYVGRGEEVIGRPLQAGRLQRQDQRGSPRRSDDNAQPNSLDSLEIREIASIRAAACGP